MACSNFKSYVDNVASATDIYDIIGEALPKLRHLPYYSVNVSDFDRVYYIERGSYKDGDSYYLIARYTRHGESIYLEMDMCRRKGRPFKGYTFTTFNALALSKRLIRKCSLSPCQINNLHAALRNDGQHYIVDLPYTLKHYCYRTIFNDQKLSHYSQVLPMLLVKHLDRFMKTEQNADLLSYWSDCLNLNLDHKNNVPT